MKNILVIPFYKNENYIDNFVKYFSENPNEYSLFEKICIFNDCPESAGSIHLEERCTFAKFEYIKNDRNLGFLKTVNRGFLIAKDFDANLVILNSDTLPYKNSFYELLKCFEVDSMLGCVAPRSNNATICNLFAAPVYIDGQDDLVDICKIFEESKKYAPKITYSPVTNGFCMAVRSSVLNTLQGYSDEFDPGYEEENDYCLRVASLGFRIGISNHSFVGHLEGKSFGLNHGRDKLKSKNHQLLLSKYPGYYRLIEMYGHEYSTNAYRLMLSALKKGRQQVLVDVSNLGAYHNGTNKLIVESIRALASLGFVINLYGCNELAFLFHGLNEIPEVSLTNSLHNKFYYFGIKIGQPFSHGDLITIPSHSLLCVNIFFDTIAIDCQNLYFENPKIYGLWATVNKVFHYVSFISNHSLNQYRLRFPSSKESNLNATLLPRVSHNIGDDAKKSSPIKENYALVVGNKFLHKGLAAALQQLPKFVGMKYVVFSSDKELLSIRNDIELLPVGEMSEDDVQALYENCHFVVFPSFAEGYGFPLVEALSYGKKIYLRDIECFREICYGLDKSLSKLVCFTDDFSLIEINSSIVGSEKLKFHESYNEYIGSILAHAEESNSTSLYKNFIDRLQLITLLSSYFSQDSQKDMLLRRIYRVMYKIKILRIFLRALKNTLLKYKIISNHTLA